MTNYPKISIITPSYNQGRFLEKTILSVLNQNYPNLQYIIIDGGSSDNSVEIIKKYEKQLFYWVSEKDNGQSHALNKGFQKANGDIIAWINSDDWYEDDVFGKIAAHFLNNPKSKLLIGNCKVVFNGNSDQNYFIKPVKTSFYSMLKYWENNFCPPQPAIFFSGKFLEKGFRLDENLHYAMDLDLWLKLSENNKFNYMDLNISNYLIHDSSKSGEGIGFIKFIPEWKKVCLKHSFVFIAIFRAIFYMKYYFNNIMNKLTK